MAVFRKINIPPHSPLRFPRAGPFMVMAVFREFRFAILPPGLPASPSTPGEVNIQAGVAKLITIVAAEPKQNSLLIPELVAGVVLAAALAYLLYLKLPDILRSAKPAAIHSARIKPNGSAAKTRMAGGKRRKRARVRKSGRGGSPPKRMARRGSAQGPKRAGKARQKRGRQPA